MKESPVTVEKKIRTRAEGIVESFAELMKRSRCLREESERVSRLITGEVPRDENETGNEKRDEPDNFLSALEGFIEETLLDLRTVEKNVDHVKEQVAVGLFAKLEAPRN